MIEDPEVLTKPWHIARRCGCGPNERIREYECIESNEDLPRFEQLLDRGLLKKLRDPLCRRQCGKLGHAVGDVYHGAFDPR